LAKISATELIQELPPVLKLIDQMYWSIDRIFETLQDQEQKQKRNINSLSFFFFCTNQKLIDSNMKHKTTQKKKKIKLK